MENRRENIYKTLIAFVIKISEKEKPEPNELMAMTEVARILLTQSDFI